MKAKDEKQSWPPEVKCIVPDVSPESLSGILRTLLTGIANPDRADSGAERVQCLVQSFGQDIVYEITCGKMKPTKYIALSFSVKSLTGNVELISILNHLGHCVAYSQMQELDTALSLQKLSASGGDPALPGNIFPGIFTTLAGDTIDRLEETLGSEGTSHRVSSIAVQEKLPDRTPP